MLPGRDTRFAVNGDVRPSASRDTAATIPGARLLVLPGVGHLPPRSIWPVIAAEMRALADRRL